MPKIKSFLKLGIKDQLLFAQAFALSGFFRFLMLYVRFKYLKKQMGIPKIETSYEVPSHHYEEAMRIRRIILLVCNHTPWESKCLVRALLIQYFLKRKKIPTTLYLGVNKDELHNMNAHAWIRCGSVIVIGGNEQKQFVEVAKFSNESLIK